MGSAVVPTRGDGRQRYRPGADACSVVAILRSNAYADPDRALVRRASGMAVYRLLRNKAFEPEAITMMTRAYADVCLALGVSDRDRPEADAVAKKVFEFAQRGERDPARL